jgi:MFS family permease
MMGDLLNPLRRHTPAAKDVRKKRPDVGRAERAAERHEQDGIEGSGQASDYSHAMRLPRGVWQIGWVSFFTDFASEMIYPLLPLFLSRSLGAGAMSLGIIEGVAEASNSALKIVSGWLSDRWNRRKPIVVFGYTLSSSVRPLMAAAGAWWHVLGLRFADRLGKGIRGAPRDAMLAAIADHSNRGRIFGFHRGMDHAGAVAGPIAAALFLFFYPGEYRTLFALTIIPGIVVVYLVATLPKDTEAERAGSVSSPAITTPGDRRLPPQLWTLLLIILIFSLGNASDAFLLLRLGDLGVAPTLIPLLWAALHVVKSTSSVYGGRLSDRFGRTTLIAAGWLWYAIVYAGFAYFDSPVTLIPLFVAYGLHFGLTEGAEKALVADLTPPHGSGMAFGLYNAVLGIGALAASLLFGWIWTAASPAIAFGTGAVLALIAAALVVSVFGRAR